jgi:cytochrome c5
MLRSWPVVVAIVSGWLLAGCGESADRAGSAASDPDQTAASQPEPAQEGRAGSAPQQVSLADVFPPGPGRDLVFDTCGSCHPVACSAIGQRTAQRWESIRDGHTDTLTGYSSADVETMFLYLSENFNDSKPEPQIPPEFLQPGCTPF